ncbi:MAG: TetR/AcrR family transcriptional regulator, partial [Eggerthellaceae bacterium]|nr:TetR/AcrR family transcriptional regulator [Eggerthellaceae bacterium]
MFTFESDTREALLKSGRDEILEKGFEKASLRSVCAHAGLTTGAFYSNFMRKEDLLVAIVEDELAACDCSYDGIVDIIVADFKGNLDAEIKSAEFVVAHKELLKLLLDCSEGSCYEDFKERLCDKLADAYGALLRGGSSDPVDCNFSKIIAQMKLAEFNEL